MVILDIEVFKYDLLTGIKRDGKYEFYWNNDAKEVLQQLHESQEVVVNFNGEHYDLPVLYNYYFNKRNVATFFELSKYIVEKGFKLVYPNFWNSIDIMANLQTWFGLKVIEAILGWEIRETTIDFKYEYKLTEEQRREVEYYNKQDLDATEAMYNKMKYHFECREAMCKWLGIEHSYQIPLPTLVGMGLGAHRTQNKPPIKPDFKCYDLPIKHEVKQVMLKQMEELKQEFSYDFKMGDQGYTVGNGGIHSHFNKWNGNDVWHVDVKGYYSLIMMNYKLFSRNIPQTGIDKYIEMYFERLRLKKTNPLVADSLKIGILAVWGATRNPHHILFDYNVGMLITLYGQLFLLYLMELFTDNGILILNANTDGLIVKGDLDKIQTLTKQWDAYGGWDTEIDHYERFVQKDVNNYLIGNSLDKLKSKGRDFSAIKPDWLFSNIIVVPQTAVISKLLAKLLFENIDNPEVYAREHIKDYPIQDYMFIVNHTHKFDGMRFVETQEKLQRVNRVYASKGGYTIEKLKFDSTYKYPGLPPCRVCNTNLETTPIPEDLDYEWYVQEIMRKYVTYV